MRPLPVAAVMIALLSLSGCWLFDSPKPIPPSFKPRPPVVDIQRQVVLVGNIKDKVDTTAGFIKEEAKDIQAQVASAQKQAPDLPELPVIGRKADNIGKSGDVILEESARLLEVQSQLVAAKQEAEDIRGLLKQSDAVLKKLTEDLVIKDKALQTAGVRYDALLKEKNEEIRRLEDESTSFMKTICRWILGASLGLGILAIALGVYLRNSGAFGVGGLFLAIASVTYFVSKYMWVMLWAGGGIVVVGVVLLAIYLKRHETALAEQVEKIEELDDDAWAKLKPLLKTTSATTENLVSSIRTQLKHFRK